MSNTEPSRGVYRWGLPHQLIIVAGGGTQQFMLDFPYWSAVMARAQTVSVTTNSSGAATVYSGKVRGRVLTISYVKDTFDDGVDFTITTEDTLQNLWVESNVNASEIVNPRQQVHDTVGVATTIDGTRAMRDYVFATNERIKIVIASGGATKAGSFVIISEE